MRSDVILFVVSSCALQGITVINGQHYYYPVVPPSLHCLKKTCEQIVTGRHLPYAKVLSIIHHRDYLNAIYINKVHPHHPPPPSPATATHTGNARRKKRQIPTPATHSGNARRKKRQIPTLDSTGHIQGMSPPLLVGIPLVILSAMFIASLRKNQQKPEIVEEVTEIIVDTPPKFTPLTPPHLPAPGQPVGLHGFAKL